MNLYKKCKSFISLVCAVSLILSIICVPVAADDTNRVTAATGAAIAQGNSAYCYDKTAMTLVSVENGDFYQNSEWTKGNLNADVYTLSYEAGGFEDITTASGLLATLNFRVNENAAPGNYEVKATYRSGDIINVSFDEIAFAVTNGSVAVEARPVPVTGISLDKTTARMATGETLALTPVFAPETATNKTVIWSSSDNTIATVDDGIVTAVKKGSATITVKTEDGGFTASCVVTVNCAHANKTEHPAEASTCTKHGHADYTTCDDCGEVIEGSANELPLAAHTGGTATCKDKAVCEICGEEYGKLNPENHTGEEVWEQTETTHTKKWNCCGKVTVAESDHEFEDGVCTVCAYPCAHKDENTDHVCDICGVTVSEHTDDNNDHKCDICGKSISNHADDDNNHICDLCGKAISNHVDSNNDHVCDICGKTVSNHVDDNTDHICDICGKTISNHIDDDNNHLCDTCGKAVSNHVDDDNNHVCDTCGKAISNHVDSNNDHVCDICGKAVSNHVDDDNNHVCDICGKAITNHVDENNNHVCDICGKTVSNHVDDDNNHICDLCGKTVSNHVDDDNNHICDLCGKIVSNHSDENHDHVCDICGETISTHTGGTATCTKKAVCEICGEAYGEVDSENHTGGTHLEHEKAATCTEKGYTGDTYCNGCNEKIADGSEIPTKPHTPGEKWVIENGKKVKKCTECGAIAETAPRMPGDVDGDGEITMLDCLYLKRYILGTFSGEIVLENADVDGNGRIDATDYLYLKRGYLGTFDLSKFA